MTECKEIVVTPIVMPAVTAEQALVAFQAYQDLATKILTKEDVQNIQGKEFKKKSYWRKCQRFFNLSMQIVNEVREEHNGYFMYKFVARATAPNGAFVEGTGTCSSNEKGLMKTEHNTRAIAETRAKNRAIADLVAFGEVSAEEVESEPNGQSDNNPKSEPKQSGNYISEKQAKRLFALLHSNNKSPDQLKEYMKAIHGIEHTKDIIKGEMAEDIEAWITSKDEYIPE